MEFRRLIPEWPVLPLRGRETILARAAEFALRARAAKLSNSRNGLRPDHRRGTHAMSASGISGDSVGNWQVAGLELDPCSLKSFH